MHADTILIIGKNGKTGSRVVQRLEELGHATRGVSRSTTPSFDWENPKTWAQALAGTSRAYVTYQPDLAVPGAEATIREFLAQAKALGLQHIVLLSGRGEAGAQRAEQLLIDSGLTWNVVRASWFAQNFSESFLLDGVLAGEVFLPVGEVPEPFIDADDIAEVAVAALTRPELHNHLFEVTGPRAMSFAQAVKEISAAVGYSINYTEIPLDVFIAEMQKLGAPEEMQWLLRELFSNILDGRNSQTASGVEEALGRPATDFAEYVQKTLAYKVWKRAA